MSGRIFCDQQTENVLVEEQECFLNFVKENAHYKIYYPMLIFALSTALRVGELTGLRWADIDLKQSVVHVRQQLRYLNFGDGCKFHVMPLKTEAGRRDIPLTGIARKALTMQKELSLMLGRTAKKQEVCGIDDFVFINSQGMPNATSAINCVLNEIVRAHNRIETVQAEKEHREPFLLPHISAHILRHTACTRLAETGIEPKVLQCIMGHSSISVTMDVYTHMDFSQIQKQMQDAEAKIKIG